MGGRALLLDLGGTVFLSARAAGITVGALTNDLRAFHGDGAMNELGLAPAA